MKINIETLKNTFEVGYNTYKSSYAELEEVQNLYHNRQYTSEQLQILEDRGSPAETFNIIKLFDRAMLGYFSTVINNIKTVSLEESEMKNAQRINKALNYILRLNSFEMKKETLLLNSLHSGLIVTYLDVVKLQDKDNYGRPMVDITLDIINPKYCVLDPKSEAFDYSDARFFHTYKWVDEGTLSQIVTPQMLKKLQEDNNHLNTTESEYTNIYGNSGFSGHYKLDNEYLIVSSMMKDDKGVHYQVTWCGDTIIAKSKIKYDSVLPYRVVKLHETETPEFYGIYREIVETQKSINQALISIQQLVNTNKVIVQDGAVAPEDWEQFKTDVTKVNAILKVTFLDGIRFQDMSADIAQQYRIISSALERVQQILHINDSFLGQAASSDSGRKVNMQKTSSIVALRYVVTKLEYVYKVIGIDLINLIKQYYNAEMSIPTTNSYGQEEYENVNVPLTDPDTGDVAVDYVKDEKGKYVKEVVNDPDTELDFDRMDIMVTASNFDDSAEADKLMLEQTLQGPVGSFIQQADPASFLQMASLTVRQKRTKHSEEIAELINQVAQKLGGAPTQDPRAEMAQGGAGGGSPMDVAHTMGLSNEIKHPTER